MSVTASVFTATIHRQSYAAISSSRPELSQHGRNVLVTGSSSGIGLAICRSFAEAGAAAVVLTGRSKDSLDEAVADLKSNFPSTTFVGKHIDVADAAAVEILWKDFASDGFVVDVLVLNAARVQPKACSMLEAGLKEIAADFAANVHANMRLADLFYHQDGREKSRRLVRV